MNIVEEIETKKQLNISETQNWKETEEEWMKEFQDLVIGEGHFQDLKLYADFLGHPLPEKGDCVGLAKELFQSEVHRLFPAEQETLEREKLFKFDCHVLILESNSRLFNLLIRILVLQFYLPVIVDLHDILKKSYYFCFSN
jgi:hypothetical protein